MHVTGTGMGSRSQPALESLTEWSHGSWCSLKPSLMLKAFVHVSSLICRARNITFLVATCRWRFLETSAQFSQKTCWDRTKLLQLCAVVSIVTGKKKRETFRICQEIEHPMALLEFIEQKKTKCKDTSKKECGWKIGWLWKIFKRFTWLFFRISVENCFLQR